MNQIHLNQPQLELEKIAEQTWTGQQANRFRFNKVEVEAARSDDDGKSYHRFRVSFWRPNFYQNRK